MTALTHPKGQRIDVPADTVADYKKHGWVEAGEETPVVPEPVEIPEGAPTDEWKVDQIDAYAEREGIEVTGKKGDKLATIAEHIAAKA